MSKTKNDIAWEKLFEKYKIIENIDKEGQFLINSIEINEFREARLMTKFDYRSQLPQLFAENQLSILPISRGSYLISTFNTFHEFDNNEVEITKIDFPNYIESIDYNNITSEATALNCAYISGIIEDFTGDEDIKPAVNGRMSSLAFDFNINAKNGLLDINVQNSQIEIDGGYEGVNYLSLIEAKNSLSQDFLVRQLYYPYKLWSNKITKIVKPLFLTYTNGIFHLREYTFENPNHYNSIKLIRQKKYAIREGVINIELIQKALNNIVVVDEPRIPFPQADSFERVINLCELLNDRIFLNQEEITSNYDFDKRQTDYYTNAGKYLGLIDKKRENNEIVYFLSQKGTELFKFSIFDRQIEYAKIILSHYVFNKTLEYYFKKGDRPNKQEIVEIMKKSKLYNVDSDSTFNRRSSTISSWINWIMDLIEE